MGEIMDLTNIALDNKKEKEGVWFDIDGETSVLVARMYNPNFQKLFERLSMPYRNSAKRGLLKDEKAEEILSKVLSKTVLLDWKGLTLAGKQVKYSTDKAAEILSDKKYSTFRQIIIDYAEEQSNYRNAAIEEDVKK